MNCKFCESRFNPELCLKARRYQSHRLSFYSFPKRTLPGYSSSSLACSSISLWCDSFNLLITKIPPVKYPNSHRDIPNCHQATSRFPRPTSLALLPHSSSRPPPDPNLNLWDWWTITRRKEETEENYKPRHFMITFRRQHNEISKRTALVFLEWRATKTSN